MLSESLNRMQMRDGTQLDATMARGDGPLFGAVPGTWEPPKNADGTWDRLKFQLVACVYLDAIEEQKQSPCVYYQGRGAFLFARADLTVVVREASTGHTVSSFPLRSGPSKDCPPTIDETETHGPHTWIIPPLNVDFVAGLRPPVEKQL